MKMAFIVALTILAVTPGLCRGQVGGNAAYGQAGGKARAEQSERNKRVVAPAELPPTNTSTFVEANVLMNVKADDYVALFAVAREAPTVAECGQKMDATIKAFTDRLKTTMYDSYAAYESETMSSNAYRQRYTVQSARKTRTFFFNGLDGDGFDVVINPVVIEPVVQFTLYLIVRYDSAPSPVK